MGSTGIGASEADEILSDSNDEHLSLWSWLWGDMT